MKRLIGKSVTIGLLAAALIRPAAADLVDYVNPLVGTHGKVTSILYGGMMPMVGEPFAMIQWTPMTRLAHLGRVSYNYGDAKLIGFIGTRQPAIWMGDYGGFSLMPGRGEVRVGYAERALNLDKKSEIARPDYYAVTAGGIRTELSAATRASIFRFTFPGGDRPWLVVDAGREEGSPGWIRVEPNQNRIVGYNTDRWSKELGPLLPNFKGWFVVEFDRPLADWGTYSGKALNPGQAEAAGDAPGAFVRFEGSGPLLARIGTSLISLEQAEANLRAEIPGWELEAVSAATRRVWNERLARIQVEGGSEAQKKIFYTAMYRAHQYPRVFDEGGRYYSAFDDRIHQGRAFNDYSLWDTFRAEHPLLILTAGELVAPMVTSLLQMYQEGGWLPKWPNPTYTGIMIGSHSDSVIADAWVKGIRNFDLKLAYEAVRKNAFVPPEGDESKRWADRAPWTSVESRGGLSYYLKLGYVPADKTDESVSRTLEFAYDDFAVAQLAQAVGAEDDYRELMARTKNYRNLFNHRKLRARNADGSWAGKKGLTEALSWGYIFCAMQDMPGLIELFGGPRGFEKKLDKVFAMPFTYYRYIHMNEPQHHYPYLYDYSGSPWKTQKQVRRIMRQYYYASPNGLLGDDDAGQMSAWYIFSSLGFYPVTPGSPVYAVGSPIWDRAVITLGEPYGRAVFTIRAENNSPQNIYVQSLSYNGQPLETPFITHSQIVAGGELVFVMGPKPNREWGRTPPSMEDSAQNR